MPSLVLKNHHHLGFLILVSGICFLHYHRTHPPINHLYDRNAPPPLGQGHCDWAFVWFFVFFFLVCLHSLQDFSSHTRDRTQALSVKAPSPNHWSARKFPSAPFKKMFGWNPNWIINFLWPCPIFYIAPNHNSSKSWDTLDIPIFQSRSIFRWTLNRGLFPYNSVWCGTNKFRVQFLGCSLWYQFSLVAQSYPTLCDPMDWAYQASLSITNSRSLQKLMSIESVMPPNHLVLI